MSKNKKGGLLIFIKKHKWEIIPFLVLFLIPIFIQTNLLYFGTWILNFINIGKPGNWLGFWGSYLGSILSIAFAYVNTKMQLKESKRNDYEKAIKLRELDSTVSLLQAASYLKTYVHSLKEEFEFNKNKSLYKDLFIDYWSDIYKVQHSYIRKYNYAIDVYNAKDTQNIVMQNKEITKCYLSLVRTVNINLFNEISDKIKAQSSEKICENHKKAFFEACDQAKALYTECERFTEVVDSFYENQKKQITS